MQRVEIIVLPSAVKVAEFVVSLFSKIVNMKGKGEFMSVALSGGSTPRSVFEHISSHGKDLVRWNKIRFFWVDERCVSPDDPESNYRMAKLSLLDRLSIQTENIFRIIGEADPFQEVIRYRQIITREVAHERNLPQFDLVLLGLGEDGHTASIFPGNIQLFHSGDYCAIAIHPQTGQQRITLTGPVINNAQNVVFMVTGTGKAQIVADVILEKAPVKYPASLVRPKYGTLTWLLDADAARMLK